MFVGKKLAASAGRLSPATLKAALSLWALWLVSKPPTDSGRGGKRGGEGSFLETVLGSSLIARAFEDEGVTILINNNNAEDGDG